MIHSAGTVPQQNHRDETESLPLGRSRVDVSMLFIECTKDPVRLIEMIRIPESQGLLLTSIVKEMDRSH